MFGMGFTEIFFIAVIAIIFLGPEKLPDALVKIAKTFNSIKKSVTDAKSSIESELNMHDLREDAISYKRNISDDISGFKNSLTRPIDDFGALIEEEIYDDNSSQEPEMEMTQVKKKKKKAKKTKSESKKKKADK